MVHVRGCACDHSEAGGASVLGSFAALHHILQDSQRFLQVSQCSIQKALERACTTCKQAFGAAVHDKFWKVAKFLSNNPLRTFEVRKEIRPIFLAGWNSFDLTQPSSLSGPGCLGAMPIYKT